MVLIFGGGGEGVRARPGGFGFPGPAVTSETRKASLLDIVGRLPPPLFPRPVIFDSDVLSSGPLVPPGELCVSVDR